MKDTKTQMSQTISGSSADSYYQKNAGRTKEAMLNKATIVAAIVFFVLALAVNIINVYWGGSDKDTGSSSSAISSSTSSSDSSTDSSDSSDSSADSSESNSDSSGSSNSSSSDAQ